MHLIWLLNLVHTPIYRLLQPAGLADSGPARDSPFFPIFLANWATAAFSAGGVTIGALAALLVT